MLGVQAQEALGKTYKSSGSGAIEPFGLRDGR